ncbi:MAG: hypothetical protein K2X03_05265 [Bryobacteraceae bacterium]|nr:hypothetical protein [Bryobacteraceae bacterium]
MKHFLLLWLAVASLHAADAPVFAEIRAMTAEIERITGWKAKRKVPAAMMSKRQLDTYLNERMKEDVKPSEIRAEEVTLRRLGFIGEQVDLKQSMLEVMNEQAAAFYDTRKKRLYLMETTGEQMQSTVLVHELSHAIADQQHGLYRFLAAGGDSDDAHLARMAVTEGQATWLMSEYIAQRNGSSLVGRPDVVQTMAKATSGSSPEFPALDAAPLYLQETFLFPYSQGLVFQAKVIEKLGKPGYSEVFRRPPATTQQILHPELYLQDVRPPRLSLPSGKYPDPVLSDGLLGELDHQILLRQFQVTDWEKIAGGWTASRYRVFEDKARTRVSLVYVSLWRDEAAAEAFFAAYRKSILPGKLKQAVFWQDAASLVTGKAADGYFRLERRGREVTVREGLPGE